MMTPAFLPKRWALPPTIGKSVAHSKDDLEFAISTFHGVAVAATATEVIREQLATQPRR